MENGSGRSVRWVGAVAVALGLSAGPASAQLAYFSVEGKFATSGDLQDFTVNLSRAVDDSQPLEFETHTFVGGTNKAGDTITASGFDANLNLLDTGNAVVGQNDQIDFSGDLDALLTWNPPQTIGTPLPSPLAAGDYRLNLAEFGGNTAGWALDLSGPADALSLTGATATGTSTIDSLKFGTIPTGMGTNPAVFNISANLTINDRLVVGQSGSAVLNHTAGTLTLNGSARVGVSESSNATDGVFNVTGVGTAVSHTDFFGFTVGSFGTGTGELNIGGGAVYTTAADSFSEVSNTGTLNINDTGTLNINHRLLINEGKLNLASSGTFNLATNGLLNVIDGANVVFNRSYELDDNTEFRISGGSTFTSTSFLDIANGTDATLDISGTDTQFTTNTASTTFLDWGISGGTATIDIDFNATAIFHATSINMATGGSAGSAVNLDIRRGGSMTANSLSVATGTQGDATINVNGTGSTNNRSTLNLNPGSVLNLGSNSSAGTAAVNLTDNGTLNADTIIVNQTGTLDLDGGHLVTASISHTGGGTVNFTNGSLTVTDFDGSLTQDGGVLIVGGRGSVGDTEFTGNFNVEQGVSAFEVLSDTEFDTLTVDFTANLIITPVIDIGTLGTAGLDAGDTLRILTAGSAVQGTYQQERLPVFNGLTFDVVYGSDFVDLLVVAATTINGDFDGSGQVEQGDLDLVLQNWGVDTLLAGLPAGWVNDNGGVGQVEQTELDQILQNWGSTTAPDFAGSNVPEPTALALLGGLSLITLRRRAA